MSVKVYVWNQCGGNVGHASMQVDDVYISFWPDDDLGKPQAKKGLKLKLSHKSIGVDSLADDIGNENGRRPTVIELDQIDLNKNAVFEYWADVLEQGMRYQLRKRNCSSIVAECLYQGTKRKASFVPSASDYSRMGGILGYGMWTPAQVMRYAMELRDA